MNPMHPLCLTDLGRPLRVLCLGAHSDDIEIGCGASLLALAQRTPGLSICWVVLGVPDLGRAEEARSSAQRWLGERAAVDVRLQGFSDGWFPALFGPIKDYFTQLRSAVDPDLIFTHCMTDRHQDHRVVGELTWQTWRHHTILEYEIPKFDGDLGQPNLYFNVSAQVAEAKIHHLMHQFGSQRSKDWFDADTFRGLMRIRGLECRAEERFAEAFYARKLVV